jgi:hypothetical protein
MSELEQELSAWQLSIQSVLQAGIAEGCSGADLGHYDLPLFERFTQDKLVVLLLKSLQEGSNDLAYTYLPALFTAEDTHHTIQHTHTHKHTVVRAMVMADCSLCRAPTIACKDLGHLCVVPPSCPCTALPLWAAHTHTQLCSRISISFHHPWRHTGVKEVVERKKRRELVREGG